MSAIYSSSIELIDGVGMELELQFWTVKLKSRSGVMFRLWLDENFICCFKVDSSQSMLTVLECAGSGIQDSERTVSEKATARGPQS